MMMMMRFRQIMAGQLENRPLPASQRSGGNGPNQPGTGTGTGSAAGTTAGQETAPGLPPLPGACLENGQPCSEFDECCGRACFAPAVALETNNPATVAKEFVIHRNVVAMAFVLSNYLALALFATSSFGLPTAKHVLKASIQTAVFLEVASLGTRVYQTVTAATAIASTIYVWIVSPVFGAVGLAKIAVVSFDVWVVNVIFWAHR
ncbi:expressed unknown protein [Seminavis robusta]|uniref:Uncharacterized protein n=1 Tax=Seminavis robusta TaxID=568900 RepID=A0A9N8DNF2_9STRA|nr:expressed unknown protein [Seminavis robusta]|eukprot:Sro226_g091932.1  (205) ;mRNA; f:7485-8099